MQTLRLTQTTERDGRYRVDVALEGAGVRQTATAWFAFALSATERERIRWYLEDYLEYPMEPAPQLAAGVETRLGELGTQLFRNIFQATDDTRDLWSTLRLTLEQTRVEVVSDVGGAIALPWELLRDPKTGVAVALRAAAFVRAQHQTSRPARLPALTAGERLRVLLVICRPAGRADVPFRSVASHLIRLSREARGTLQLDLLRPPTFARFSRMLEQAAQGGKPYHVVHFDGHGTYTDMLAHRDGRGGSGRPDPWRYGLLSPPRPGEHGYLLFEDPTVADNVQLVDGPALGARLVETGVPVLVLNACRSAYAEAPTRPQPEDPATADVHARIRSYGTLAQEVVDAGLPGIVAMRYSVYVVTAAQFLADLYASLLGGRPLGEAVSQGRRQLAAQPNRQIAFDPRPLQDWSVPVVYEAAPLTLFPTATAGEGRPVIRLEQTASGQERGRLASPLPDQPDVGFYGRDETLLALDRAFDDQPIVLLHGLAGAGKTATAVEFARWYQVTGGLGHPDLGRRSVLFTSFEHYLPPTRVLDQLGAAFADLLAASGIAWLTLDDAQRRQRSLALLAQLPVLWIWDNVEPVAGFPADTRSAWSAEEQAELLELLRALRDTKAKVLLTSRRDESGWLGGLPVRIELSAMPMRERLQLAQAIISRRPPHRLAEVDDWRPLLRYTGGNPLTITVLVSQALRQRLTSRTQIEAFLARLRAGEADLADDATQGRTRSLAASLSYGLEQAVTDRERPLLAVLHLFHDVVEVGVLVAMGNPAADGGVAELAGLTRPAVTGLLDRVADVGLLEAYGGGHYGIHPALPWYFSALFTAIYGPADHGRAVQVARAYVHAVAAVSEYWKDQFEAGGRQEQVAGVLAAEEANLLHARALARRHGWWHLVLSPMQGLRVLYDFAGRTVEWARLVDELIPDLVDPRTDGPRPGREDEWALFTDYRVGLAEENRNWAEAERLHHAAFDWTRQQAAAALTAAPGRLTDMQRRQLRNLAASLQTLGHIRREQGRPDCRDAYQQALELVQRIAARPEEAVLAFNLGHSYLNVSQLRNLDQAEYWYQTSLQLRDAHDRLGQALCHNQLGRVAYDRFAEARDRHQPKAVQLDHLKTAATAYHRALSLLPDQAITDRGVAHHQLGLIYDAAGQTDRALNHFQRSIRYHDEAGNRYRVGQSRQEAAVTLANASRFDEALLYAQAALRDYETYGPAAFQNVFHTRRLMDRIQLDLAAGPDPEDSS